MDVEGAPAPTIFYNPQSSTRCAVHGNDFRFLGYEDELHVIEDKIGQWYELNVRGSLETDNGDAKTIVIFNREMEITESGFKYRADSKHAQIIWKKMGVTWESNGVTTAFVRDNLEEDEVTLNAAEQTLFRQVAARAN